MRFVLIGLIKLYKRTLSPVIGGGCIYTPTCSSYGLEAVREFGALRGGLYTAWRILRCAPWGKGGFDPVPYNLKGEMKWLL
jgi:putative membrane protein insertion efficiency factor